MRQSLFTSPSIWAWQRKKPIILWLKQATDADLVIVFGSSLPNSAELVGKKVFLVNEDAAIASPEVTLTNALNQAVDYVQPAQSAVGFCGVSGVKNIVAVTACPTGLRSPL